MTSEILGCDKSETGFGLAGGLKSGTGWLTAGAIVGWIMIAFGSCWLGWCVFRQWEMTPTSKTPLVVIIAATTVSVILNINAALKQPTIILPNVGLAKFRKQKVCFPFHAVSIRRSAGKVKFEISCQDYSCIRSLTVAQ
jgi:hypothetical protein